MTPGSYRKSLLVAGAALFLLGLLQGAAVHSFLNPRMALSAHLTAVQSGMAIMIAGLAWPMITLAPALKGVAHWTLVAGMYGLWIALTLSAATGASDALPIAGAGYSAAPSAEQMVSALIVISSAAMVLGWGLLTIGLFRSEQA
ncbi:MAG: hydrogenase [Pseudomonadota bacterium]